MKFSIRDLLLVTVIVALAAAWFVDRTMLGEQVEMYKREAEVYKANDKITEDYLNEVETKRSPPPNSLAPASNQPKE